MKVLRHYCRYFHVFPAAFEAKMVVGIYRTYLSAALVDWLERCAVVLSVQIRAIAIMNAGNVLIFVNHL